MNKCCNNFATAKYLEIIYIYIYEIFSNIEKSSKIKVSCFYLDYSVFKIHKNQRETPLWKSEKQTDNLECLSADFFSILSPCLYFVTVCLIVNVNHKSRSPLEEAEEEE